MCKSTLKNQTSDMSVSLCPWICLWRGSATDILLRLCWLCRMKWPPAVWKQFSGDWVDSAVHILRPVTNTTQHSLTLCSVDFKPVHRMQHSYIQKSKLFNDSCSYLYTFALSGRDNSENWRGWISLGAGVVGVEKRAERAQPANNKVHLLVSF